MFDYVLYSQRIRSSFPLHHVPEQPLAPGALPDIQVTVRFDANVATSNQSGWTLVRQLEGRGWSLRTERQASATDSALRLDVTSTGRRSVVTIGPHGSSIDIAAQLSTETDEAYSEQLSGWITGSLLAQALVLRGHAVLHASVVATPAGAVAFLGDSGHGKSSLAAHLVQAGYQFVADDHLVLSRNAAAPAALFGPPRLRLVADPAGAMERARDADGKVYVPVHRPTERHRHVQVAAILELGGYLAEEAPVYIEPLAATAALALLMRHRFVQAEVYDGATAATLRQLAKVAADVPVYRLHRPRGLDRLPDVASSIVKHIAARGAPS